MSQNVELPPLVAIGDGENRAVMGTFSFWRRRLDAPWAWGAGRVNRGRWWVRSYGVVLYWSGGSDPINRQLTIFPEHHLARPSTAM